MLIKIHNAETGEITEREMTDTELEQVEKDQAQAEARVLAEIKAMAKRQAILDRLGITEEEAKLLLG